MAAAKEVAVKYGPVRQSAVKYEAAQHGKAQHAALKSGPVVYGQESIEQ